MGVFRISTPAHPATQPALSTEMKHAQMKSKLTKTLETFAKIIPTSIYPRLVRRDVVSVFYHAVSDARLDHVRHLYPVVPVADFEAALQYMRAHFKFVTYEQLDAHRAGRSELPPNAVQLSFDDGFVECFSVVRPILLEQKVPCTFFLTLDWIDNQTLYYRHLVSLCVQRVQDLSADQYRVFLENLNRRLELSFATQPEFIQWITHIRTPDIQIFGIVCDLLDIVPTQFLEEYQPYLTTTQIQQMHAEGFTIGAHGLSHRKLGFIPKAEVETEIVASCRAIQEISGQEIVPFSFPQSAGNLSRAQLAGIRARHPFIGLLFDTKDLRQDEKFIVNRVWAERPLTPERRLHSLSEIFEHAYRTAWMDDMLKLARKIK